MTSHVLPYGRLARTQNMVVNLNLNLVTRGGLARPHTYPVLLISNTSGIKKNKNHGGDLRRGRGLVVTRQLCFVLHSCSHTT